MGWLSATERGGRVLGGLAECDRARRSCIGWADGVFWTEVSLTKVSLRLDLNRGLVRLRRPAQVSSAR